MQKCENVKMQKFCIKNLASPVKEVRNNGWKFGASSHYSYFDLRSNFFTTQQYKCEHFIAFAAL